MDDAAEQHQDPGSERFVVLLRHGIAQSKSTEMPDRERSLTSEGHKQMKGAAKGLARLFRKPDALVSSPFVRCVQTALYVAKAYDGAVTVRTSDLLVPGSTPEDFLSFIRSTSFQRMIVVGHEPNLSRGLFALVGGTVPELELEKGGCYGVRLEGERAFLAWMLTPKLLRKLS